MYDVLMAIFEDYEEALAAHDRIEEYILSHFFSDIQLKPFCMSDYGESNNAPVAGIFGNRYWINLIKEDISLILLTNHGTLLHEVNLQLLEQEAPELFDA